jgi:hypothetical protein
MKNYSNSLSGYIRMALLVVLLLFTALAMDPPGLNSPFGIPVPVSAQDGKSWSGSWNYGTSIMTITQKGNQVTGGYIYQGHQVKLDGTVSGNKLTAKLTTDGRPTADMESTLSTDGQSMSGRVRYPTSDSWWNAECTRTGAGTGTGTGTTTDAGAGVALIAESKTATPGGTVQVPIRLDKAGKIVSMNFVLTYNPKVLKVNKVDAGPLLSGALFKLSTDQGDNGSSTTFYIYGAAENELAMSQGFSGSGILANIEFQVIGVAGSSSTLAFSEVTASDTAKSVTVTTSNGTVTVASATGPGGDGGKVKGDYNGDGKVNERDALAALKMVVKSLPVDLNLDMDNDREVTAKDALAILKMAVGK